MKFLFWEYQLQVFYTFVTDKQTNLIYSWDWLKLVATDRFIEVRYAACLFRLFY